MDTNILLIVVVLIGVGWVWYSRRRDEQGSERHGSNDSGYPSYITPHHDHDSRRGDNDRNDHDSQGDAADSSSGDSGGGDGGGE